MNLEQNIAEFLRLDRVEEQSEADAEAARWEKSRLAAEAVDGGTTQRAYANRVRKSEEQIRLLRKVWERWGGVQGPLNTRPLFADAYRMAYTRTEDIEASKEVDRLRKRLPAAPDKKAEFLAEQLTADRDVAGEAVRQVIATPSPASRRIEAVVAEREAARRKRSQEAARRKAEREAVPLPAYMSTMVVKMNDWALGLDGISDDDLDELPDGPGLDAIERALDHLIASAQRWKARLERKPDLRVIEGKARR